MLLASLPLVFVLIGVALYTALAGADFGAGLALPYRKCSGK